MDFIKIKKEGDNCHCDIDGNPKEIAEAIYTCMDKNEIVAAIIIAAAEAYKVDNPHNK